jgi:uncharacterized protein YcnI
MVPRWLLRTGWAGLGAAILAGLAPAASADVTLSPGRAEQGGIAEITFAVPDDRGAAFTSRLEVLMPAEAPLADVTPLSVDDWGPQIAYRQLPAPIRTAHGSTSTAVASVTWFRATEVTPAAGATSRLTLALGGLPTTDALRFTVVQTYSDGAVRRWNTVLTLTPVTAVDPAGSQAPAPAPAGRPRPATDDASGGLLSPGTHAVIVAALGLGLLGAWAIGRRRTRGRPEPAAGPDAVPDGTTSRQPAVHGP